MSESIQPPELREGQLVRLRPPALSLPAWAWRFADQVGRVEEYEPGERCAAVLFSGQILILAVTHLVVVEMLPPLNGPARNGATRNGTAAH